MMQYTRNTQHSTAEAKCTIKVHISNSYQASTAVILYRPSVGVRLTGCLGETSFHKFSAATEQRQPAMMAVSKLLTATGALLILHAAFSLQHYRSLIQVLEESATGISSEVIDDGATGSTVYRIPPVDVWLEMLLAFTVLLLSELTRTGSSLQPVSNKGGVPQKPMTAAPFVTRDFDIYSSRGRGFVR